MLKGDRNIYFFIVVIVIYGQLNKARESERASKFQLSWVEVKREREKERQT